MKRLLFALAATASTIAMAPAANAAVFIGVSFDGGATITNVVNDGGTGSANLTGSIGGYSFNVGASGSPLINMPRLLTQSTNVQQNGANAVVDVYVSQTGLSALNGGLRSTFTSNTQEGLSAVITSFWSQSNTAFATTNTMFNAPFTSTGTATGDFGFNAANNWTETVRYRLTFTGGAGSNFNGTANLTAVPEPATWGLLMLGFGAMGAMLRTRRRSTTARIRFA